MQENTIVSSTYTRTNCQRQGPNSFSNTIIISPTARVSTLHIYPDILNAIAVELPGDITFGITYAKHKQLYTSTKYDVPVTIHESFRRDPKI